MFIREFVNFLHRKNVIISVRRYFIDAMGVMALGLFSSLLVGMIVQTIENLSGIPFLVDFGQYATILFGVGVIL